MARGWPPIPRFRSAFSISGVPCGAGEIRGVPRGFGSGGALERGSRRPVMPRSCGAEQRWRRSEIELKVSVTIEHDQKAKGSFKVYVLEVGAEDSKRGAHAHKVRLLLAPRGRDASGAEMEEVLVSGEGLEPDASLDDVLMRGTPIGYLASEAETCPRPLSTRPRPVATRSRCDASPARCGALSRSARRSSTERSAKATRSRSVARGWRDRSRAAPTTSVAAVPCTRRR